MATFDQATAEIINVWVKFPLAAGNFKYVRQPFNLVTYDDGNQYFEPVNTGPASFTWMDRFPAQINQKIMIVDVAPGAGVTEIR